jgi:hypothetical protein
MKSFWIFFSGVLSGSKLEWQGRWASLGLVNGQIYWEIVCLKSDSSHGTKFCFSWAYAKSPESRLVRISIHLARNQKISFFQAGRFDEIPKLVSCRSDSLNRIPKSASFRFNLCWKLAHWTLAPIHPFPQNCGLAHPILGRFAVGPKWQGKSFLGRQWAGKGNGRGSHLRTFLSISEDERRIPECESRKPIICQMIHRCYRRTAITITWIATLEKGIWAMVKMQSASRNDDPDETKAKEHQAIVHGNDRWFDFASFGIFWRATRVCTETLYDCFPHYFLYSIAWNCWDRLFGYVWLFIFRRRS